VAQPLATIYDVFDVILSVIKALTEIVWLCARTCRFTLHPYLTRAPSTPGPQRALPFTPVLVQKTPSFGTNDTSDRGHR
jgi:hypothetical protein